MLEKLTRTESLTTACAITLEQVKALKADWLELEKIASGATLFQSWHWCVLGLHQMQRREKAGNEKPQVPYVFTVRENGRLIALLPLK
ncbi:MAG: hypothetical protein AAFQ10_16195, partial [Pseudomonadota bacterium]